MTTLTPEADRAPTRPEPPRFRLVHRRELLRASLRAALVVPASVVVMIAVGMLLELAAAAASGPPPAPSSASAAVLAAVALCFGFASFPVSLVEDIAARVTPTAERDVVASLIASLVAAVSLLVAFVEVAFAGGVITSLSWSGGVAAVRGLLASHQAVSVGVTAALLTGAQHAILTLARLRWSGHADALVLNASLTGTVGLAVAGLLGMQHLPVALIAPIMAALPGTLLVLAFAGGDRLERAFADHLARREDRIARRLEPGARFG